jgi:ribA/ribD-fused uncharacterized protein
MTLKENFHHDEKSICGFFGEYRFLSNFYNCKVIYDELIFNSAENAYQAAKSTDFSTRQKFLTISSKEAKNLGKVIVIREDWDSVKLTIMTKIVTDKFFRNSNLAQLLLDTGEKYLEERNYWGDTFWGVCKGKGQNNLGKILMSIRSQL